VVDSCQRTVLLVADPSVVFAALISGIAGWWSTSDASQEGAEATFGSTRLST
jgi:hypothetical protein